MPTPSTAFTLRGIDDHLGDAVGAIERQSATGRGPRELHDLMRDALGFGFRFGQAAPREFRIGEDHGWNHDMFRRNDLAGDGLNRDAAFLVRLVR